MTNKPLEAIQAAAGRTALRIGELSMRRRLLVRQLATVDAELEKAFARGDALDTTAPIVEANPPHAAASPVIPSDGPVEGGQPS